LQTNEFREDKFSRAFIILNKTGRKTVSMSQILLTILPYRLSYVWNWQNIWKGLKNHEKSHDSQLSNRFLSNIVILNRHVTPSTITDWLSARECIINSFISVYKLTLWPQCAWWNHDACNFSHTILMMVSCPDIFVQILELKRSTKLQYT
jgi:hypothetical protein